MLRFIHTIDPSVAEEFKVPAETVAVYVPEIYHSPYENSTYTLSKKSATYKEIMQFVKKYSVPLVSQRTKANEFKFTERPMIVVYFDVNYDYQYVKDTQYVRKMILEVAQHFVGSNLKFAMSNEEEFEDEIKSLGFVDSGNAINVAAFTEKQKFPLRIDDDEFSADLLAQFVEDLRVGKVRPFMKSTPVPKKQTGYVKHIVADNYDDEIHKVITSKQIKVLLLLFTIRTHSLYDQIHRSRKMPSFSSTLPGADIAKSSIPSTRSWLRK